MKHIRTDITPDERVEVDRLIDELLERAEKEGRQAGGKQLALNLRKDLRRSDWEWLSDATAEQLAKWCDPRRDTEREARVRPLVRRISELLFGRVIQRAAAP